LVLFQLNINYNNYNQDEKIIAFGSYLQCNRNCRTNVQE
jgi:hypothetical protein